MDLVPGNLYVLPTFTRYSAWSGPQNRMELFFVHIEALPDITDDVLRLPIGENTLEQSLLTTMRWFADTGDMENLDRLCHVLFSRIMERCSPNVVPLIEGDPRLERVIRYIEQHKEQKITIESLAEVAAMERSYFTRKFTNAYKIAPLQYITRRKMTLAAQELMADTSVEGISRKIAYEDVASFSRTFKRVYGVSPMEYKKSHNRLT